MLQVLLHAEEFICTLLVTTILPFIFIRKCYSSVCEGCMIFTSSMVSIMIHTYSFTM